MSVQKAQCAENLRHTAWEMGLQGQLKDNVNRAGQRDTLMVSCCQRRGLRETEMLFSKPETIILSQHHPPMTWLLLCPVIRTINKEEALRRKCRFLQRTSSPTDLTGLV